MERKIVKAAVSIIAIIVRTLNRLARHRRFPARVCCCITRHFAKHDRSVHKVYHTSSLSFSLSLAILFILGVLTLTLWLYSPLISSQFSLLVNQLPSAIDSIRESLSHYIGESVLSHEAIKNEFSLTNQKFVTQLLTLFSLPSGQSSASSSF